MTPPFHLLGRPRVVLTTAVKRDEFEFTSAHCSVFALYDEMQVLAYQVSHQKLTGSTVNSNAETFVTKCF